MMHIEIKKTKILCEDSEKLEDYITMGNLSKPKAAMGIAFVILTWSFSWPINKIGLEYMPPMLYAGIRTLIGGILFALFLLPQWRKIEWKKNGPLYLIAALFNTILFVGVQQIGLQYLPSGLFSVIVFLQPVLVVLLSWMWLKESMSIIKVVGIVIGFLGVVVVSLDGISGTISPIGILLALVTGISWATGVVYVKKTSTQVHGLWVVVLQNILGGLFLTGAGIGMEDVSAIKWSLPAILCVLYGGVIALGVTTAIYFKLMSSGESSKVASFTFLVPLIAVGIGTLFLGEPFTISILGGLVLILLSIYLVNRKNSQKTKKQSSEPYPAENC